MTFLVDPPGLLGGKVKIMALPSILYFWQKALESLRGTPQGMVLFPDDPLPLTEEDWAILDVLADSHPKLLTQEEIEAGIPDRRVALRTIQKRLPRLTRHDLVAYPEGARSGCWITNKGLLAIGRKI